MNTQIDSYTTRTNALRGAKRKGLTEGTYEVVAEGGRYVLTLVEMPEVEVEAAPVEVEPVIEPVAETPVEVEETPEVEPVIEPVAPVAETPKVLNTALTYKDLETKHAAHSRVPNPFKVVWGFLDANGKGMKRKDAILALLNKGVNYSTARTQYQLWFQKNCR